MGAKPRNIDYTMFTKILRDFSEGDFKKSSKYKIRIQTNCIGDVKLYYIYGAPFHISKFHRIYYETESK
jgi:hypothetical protein